MSRHFLNQHFVSSQQTVQLLQLMDEVHRDIEATERSIRVRLRNNLMVGSVVGGVRAIRRFNAGEEGSVEDAIEERLKKRQEDDKRERERETAHSHSHSHSNSHMGTGTGMGTGTSSAAPLPPSPVDLKFPWWTEAERAVNPYKVNLAVASYGKVCDRDGMSNIFRALTPAEYYLVATRLGWLNVLDMVNPGGLRYVLDLGKPEEEEAMRRLCNLAMKITMERLKRQEEKDEANADEKREGERLADEKVFDVWKNVYLNGKPMNVKQDAKMWAVLSVAANKVKHAVFSFDVQVFQPERRHVAVTSIVAQYRRYKARFETIKRLFAQQTPSKDSRHYASRWLKKMVDKKSREAAELLVEVEKEKETEEEEEEERSRDTAAVLEAAAP